MNTKTRSIKLVAVIAAMLAAFAMLVGCSWMGGGDSSEPQDEIYLVMFDTNGGSFVKTQRVKDGELVTEPKKPVKADNSFSGWYTDAKFTYIWRFGVDKVTKDTTLYAKWLPVIAAGEEIEEYTVTFDSDGGSDVPDQTVAVGGKAVRPSDPTRPGYTFAGWFADSACTSAWSFTADEVKSNKTIYAKWTTVGDKPGVTKYTVTFDSDGGSAVSPVTVTSGDRLPEPAAPTKAGNVFVGWFKDSKLTKQWNFNTDTVSENMSLYARWSQNAESDTPGTTEYTVTFDSDGGSSVASSTVVSGEKVTRPADPERSGYIFDGWYADTACTDEWVFSTDTVTSNMTLHAKWISSDSAPVTATFNVGLDARLDGLSNPVAQTVVAGSKLKAPALTRSGYELDGWYVENGKTKWDFSSDKLTADMTLFARWKSGGTAVAYTPTMSQNDTLYIHYLRSDNSYSNWTIYVWKDGGSNKTYTDFTTDKSGAVFAIKPSDVGYSVSSSTRVNFIVTKPGWIKDGGDNSVLLSEAQKVGNSYHWYVQEGKTGNGSAALMTISSSASGKTETLRASTSNVDRSKAQALPKAATATTCDEMGVGYQIFVASFCDSNGDGVGDLRGITSKLDYLESLNVDVLWLTPIQSSDSYHGYDCYDYYAIDKKFGTDADYRELVYKAHQKGIKIIMDLVVNHTSPQNEWFIKSKKGVVETVTHYDGRTEEVKYRDFYRWKNSGGSRYCSSGDGWYYYSSFGSSMPELNYDCQQVRDAMLDVAMYWMAYGLDGFRMDAIKHVFMWDESENKNGDAEGGKGDGNYNYNLTKNVEFFKEFNYNLKKKYKNCFLLGEQLSGNVDDVSPFYQGMDSLFDFNTYYDFPGKINAGNAGAAAGNFNSNMQKYVNNRGDRPINSMISSNHDIPRLSTTFSSDTNKMKLYFAVTMSMPGLAWIYYGDEIGLKEVGSKDNSYRQSMKWTSGYANKCTVIGYGNNNDSIKSVADQETDENSLLYYVKALTKLRNDHPALISGNMTCSEENGMLKVTVTKSGAKTVTVYHNFSGSGKTVNNGGTRIFGSSNNVQGYGTVAFES